MSSPSEQWSPPPDGQYSTTPLEWQYASTLPAQQFDPLGRPYPGFIWSGIWSFIFLLITQVVPGLAVVVLVVVLLFTAPRLFPDGMLENPDALITSGPMSLILAVSITLSQCLVIGFSWLMIRLVVGPDWPRILGLRRPGAGQLLLVLISFPAMAVIANVYYYGFARDYIPSLKDLVGLPGMEEAGRLFAGWPWPLAVLIIGMGPGIGEELWCRGFLGQGLVGRYGAWLGVLASSFYFGLIHIDPRQGSMALMMGLWLHFTYLVTRSLVVPMLLHFLNNSFSVIAMRFEALKPLDAAAETLPAYAVVATLVLLAVVAVALYHGRTRLVGLDGGPPPWQPAAPGVEHPPRGAARAWRIPRFRH